MKNCSKLTFFLGILFLSFGFQSQERIDKDELNMIIGEWTGSPTYLDYSSGKSYSMPCELVLSNKKNKLILDYTYPNEPKANGREKIKISKNGTLIDKMKVVSKTKEANDLTTITTESMGKDGNDQKAATIRKVYALGADVFKILKQVQFVGEQEWIMRSEYAFVK